MADNERMGWPDLGPDPRAKTEQGWVFLRMDDESVAERIADQERRRDRKHAQALAGLGALLVVGLAFGLLALLATYPQEIADLVHGLLYP